MWASGVQLKVSPDVCGGFGVLLCWGKQVVVFGGGGLSSGVVPWFLEEEGKDVRGKVDVVNA